MPVGLDHNLDHVFDVFVRDFWLEKVAHAVDEHGAGARPVEGLGKFLWYEAEVESLLIWMSWDSAESLRKRLGIAMLAAGAYLCAAPERIPRGVSPFDF
jgi:hypothetical protein